MGLRDGSGISVCRAVSRIMLRHRDVNSSSAAFVFGILNSTREYFNLIHAVHAIIIDWIAIGDERAFLIPIAHGQRRHAQYPRGFFDAYIFVFHKGK